MDYIHIALVTTVNVGKRFYNGLNFLLFILKLCIFFLIFMITAARQVMWLQEFVIYWFVVYFST